MISLILVPLIEPKKSSKSGVRKTTSPEPFTTFLNRDSVSLAPSHLEMPTRVVPITLGSWMLMTSSKGTSCFQNFGLHHAYSLNIHRGDFNCGETRFTRHNGLGVHPLSTNTRTMSDLRERGEFTQDKIEGNKYHIEARTMGARTLSLKMTCKQSMPGDAEMLLSCLENPEDPNYEPDNKRYMFYLVQSYFDSQNYVEAEKWYKRRAEHRMGRGGLVLGFPCRSVYHTAR